MQFQFNATNILAILAIVGAIAGLILGYVNTETAMGIVWAGLSVFGIRQAISSQGIAGGSTRNIW
jgi:hypothetical protein